MSDQTEALTRLVAALNDAANAIQSDDEGEGYADLYDPICTLHGQLAGRVSPSP